MYVSSANPPGKNRRNLRRQRIAPADSFRAAADPAIGTPKLHSACRYDRAMKWVDIQHLHSHAASELAASAERVDPARWLAPRAEGKWSPAETLEHLCLAYDVLLREIGGGPGMQVRTRWWQRILLRFTMVPKLLRGGAFPAGARSPRETRPTVTNPDQKSAIAGFRDRAARLDFA